MTSIKARLDAQVALRNREGEVSYEKPDPVLVALRYRDEWAALVCALFAYGRADAIVRFLDTLDFSLLERDEAAIRHALSTHYYRFQSGEDITEFFITLRRMKAQGSLESLFLQGYAQKRSVVDGVNAVIERMLALNAYRSKGYTFLIGTPVEKSRGASALKRWMMYLRWMVRRDAIDMGLWSGVDPADLIIPLDTHTFAVSRKLGLLERKSYDLQAAMELTQTLKNFDASDPVKYDFALYRLGQEGLV